MFSQQLDAIRDDCISSTGSQGIQTAGTASALRSHRADAKATKRGDSTKSKGGHTHLNALPYLLKNLDNALNPYAFGQMRRWYLLVKKYPKSAQEQEELDNFKWKPDPQRKKQRTDRDRPSSDRVSRRANTTPGSTDASPRSTPPPQGNGPPAPGVRFNLPPLPPPPQDNYGGYGGSGGWAPGYSNEMYARRAGHHPYYPPQRGGDYFPPHNDGGGGGLGFSRAHDNNRTHFSNDRGNSRGHGGRGN